MEWNKKWNKKRKKNVFSTLLLIWKKNKKKCDLINGLDQTTGYSVEEKWWQSLISELFLLGRGEEQREEEKFYFKC